MKSINNQNKYTEFHNGMCFNRNKISEKGRPKTYILSFLKNFTLVLFAALIIYIPNRELIQSWASNRLHLNTNISNTNISESKVTSSTDIDENKFRAYVDFNNDITDENLFDINIDEYNSLLENYNKAYEEFENQNVNTSVPHTQYFCDDAKEFNTLANRIPLIVQQKDLNAGNTDDKRGLKVSAGRNDIEKQVYDLMDHMTSSYNSVVSFKNSDIYK